MESAADWLFELWSKVEIEWQVAGEVQAQVKSLKLMVESNMWTWPRQKGLALLRQEGTRLVYRRHLLVWWNLLHRH